MATKKPAKTIAQKKRAFSKIKGNIDEGALRRAAKREGLIKGTEKISTTDMSKMKSKAKKSGNKKRLKQITLAKNYAKVGPKKK